MNVLNTVVFDLGRFGIQVVASPRHADGLLITGPVTANMRRKRLEIAYDATPAPKIVVAVGALRDLWRGPYREHPEVSNGADTVVPVNLYIPGCPPHPLTILDGLLRLIGRIEDGSESAVGFTRAVRALHRRLLDARLPGAFEAGNELRREEIREHVTQVADDARVEQPRDDLLIFETAAPLGLLAVISPRRNQNMVLSPRASRHTTGWTSTIQRALTSTYSSKTS